jgi:hypothetical protein
LQLAGTDPGGSIALYSALCKGFPIALLIDYRHSLQINELIPSTAAFLCSHHVPV